MKDAQKTKHNQVWIFDGEPELVDVYVPSMLTTEGGYVVAMELANGAIRLAATRHPAKYVSSWRHNVRRYGIPDIVRVLVSPPLLRYEAVKRGLANMLDEHKDNDSQTYMTSIESLTEKALVLLSETPHRQ